MAGVDPASARRILDALDVEIARRQAKRDASEDARWAERFDEVVVHAKRLERNWDRVQSSPLPPVSLSPDDIECLLEEVTEFAASLFTIAAAVDLQEQRREREAAGTLHTRRPVIITPRVRMPKAASEGGDGVGKGHRKSRTELAAEKAQAEMQARMAQRRAMMSPAEQAAADRGVWMIGAVKKYDQRSMTGVVILGGGVGGVEASFSGSAMVRSGLVSLHPTQKLECLVVTRPDGRMEVAELRLSVDGKTLMLDEERRRAEEAEGRYQLMTLHRRPH